jgi:DNA (cytosine-5)-methyltransferase 1
VGENVHGLVNWSGGLVFHEVQADLEAQGYEVQPFVLNAISVNAPHRRDRVWFVAYSGKFRLEQRKASGIVGERQEEICGERCQSTLQSTPTSEIGDATDTGNKRLQGDKFDGASDAGKREQGFSHSTTSKLHKISNWEQFPTVSPICSRNDGISDRLDGITFPKWRQESIKAGGNAVVPQVVLQIFKAIAEYEELIIQRPSV